MPIVAFLCRLDLFYEKRYAHTAMTNPDFVLLAKAMGVHALRCTSRADLPAAMKEFLEYPTDRPILLECCVEQNEHVYPMVSLRHGRNVPIWSYLLIIALFTGGRRECSA
jgi:thiamine pyrophosphate-dependent acetolactate synthase large subunit-like protein